jgi:CubicO group peptidase (beta-lactamase class C family)
MTAAVKFSENYDETNSKFWHEAAVVGWRPELKENDSKKTLLAYMSDLDETSQKDDEKFDYRTVLTNIVALTAERACGKKFQTLLQEYIWDKLYAEFDAEIVTDGSGFPYMGAGMNASAVDLAKFGLMLMNNGVFNGTRVIPEAWIQDTLSSRQKV